MESGEESGDQEDGLFDITTLRRRQIIFDKINKRKKSS